MDEHSGNYIVEWRKARGLSQTMIAHLLGVSQPTVHRWETDTPPPPYIPFLLSRYETEILQNQNMHVSLAELLQIRMSVEPPAKRRSRAQGK